MFHSLDPRSLLAFEAGSLCLSVKCSRLIHRDANLGFFAEPCFGPNEPIGFYYGALVYTDLEKPSKLTRNYGEGLLEVTVKDFTTWAAEIDVKATDKDGNKHTTWVVRPEFCLMSTIVVIYPVTWTSEEPERWRYNHGLQIWHGSCSQSRKFLHPFAITGFWASSL